MKGISIVYFDLYQITITSFMNLNWTYPCISMNNAAIFLTENGFFYLQVYSCFIFAIFSADWGKYWKGQCIVQ